jgi:tetraacyldisaccharide 4'-kinase
MSLAQSFRDLVSGRRKGLAAQSLLALLAAAEPPYAWAVRRRNTRFDLDPAATVRVPAPVVSVGNLTVGGTGKTPFVAWLAQWFRGQGVAVTLISRGYGARPGLPNDEALELAARLRGVPHLQNPDRVAAARQALAAEPRQVLVLDDAFQHRRLARDLDIVLLDALAPFGFGRLLPRGLLREPVESLARAQVIALSRSDALAPDERQAIEHRVQQLAPRAAWLEVVHRPTQLVAASGQTRAPAELAGLPVAAFCGIGNPEGFRHSLAACGFVVSDLWPLPDHCPYSPFHLRQLARWLDQQPQVKHVVCTRKDLVKLDRDELAGRQLWALDIELEITRGAGELIALLAPLAQRAQRQTCLDR